MAPSLRMCGRSPASRGRGVLHTLGPASTFHALAQRCSTSTPGGPMTPRSLSLLVLISTAACGSGRIVPSDTEPASAPPEATPAAAPAAAPAPAAPAPQPAAPQATGAPQASGYVPYDAGTLQIRRIGQWSNSGITTPMRQVIRDDSSYARFWSSLGAGERPSVDFTRDVVIAVAAGQQATGGHSIAVERGSQGGQGLAVQVVETSPGPGCAVTQALTQPVDDVVVTAGDSKTWSFSDRSQVNACQ